jgi:orotidine 5'-phosphate decarboxylase subfamily 2
MTDFLEKYRKIRDEKKSVLCIGLDPSPSEIREEETLHYCLEIIEKTSDYAAAYKPNSQFILFNMRVRELRELTREIRGHGCISILDHKLSDIGSSNDAAIHYIHASGFDAFTASPYPGNIKETAESAHRQSLGVLMLGLMSNSQATWVQKDAILGNKPLYQKIAEEVRLSGADGLVMGTTGHVTADDIRTARVLAGNNTLFLCPGIGAQGGEIQKAMDNAGPNVLLNVGRAITGDPSPRKKAEDYAKEMNKYR